MDKRIYEFFKELKFNDAEIENLLSIAPVLDEMEFDDVLCNMTVVVEYGYPADDISYLISLNPGFLCRNTSDLISDLIDISKNYDDVETALKNDPYLI